MTRAPRSVQFSGPFYALLQAWPRGTLVNYFSQQREQQARFRGSQKLREGSERLSAQGAAQSLPAVVKSFNEMAAASTGSPCEPRGPSLEPLLLGGFHLQPGHP